MNQEMSKASKNTFIFEEGRLSYSKTQPNHLIIAEALMETASL